MKFIVKFFPEITIKSKPVRKRFVKRLRENLRRQLNAVGQAINLVGDWDKIVVHCPDPALRAQVVDVLSRTSGIANFLDVESFELGDLDEAVRNTLGIWAERLAGKSFVVRCKRGGQHDFTSHDAERYIGGGLLEAVPSARVDLHNPDLTIAIEIRDQTLYVVNHRYAGLGGFPLGSVDPVLSLISGGFDSTVTSYMTMRRGMATHFCFFNLGGREHELGVKEVALYLWMKYGAGARVKFVSVPFEAVVAEILKQVDDSQMGVVLKRMMLRAASQVAELLNISALVTGESVAQVSSQTLPNLSVIDACTDMLVLRPLITTDKVEIIKIARSIGTEEFAAAMPEYCGVISVRPTTRAKRPRIEYEESKFDMTLLQHAVDTAAYVNIDELAETMMAAADVEVLPVPLQGAVVVDVRHPTEEERSPLAISGVTVLRMPFYELHSSFADLDKQTTYMLYCDRGVMSRLHASHLLEQGYDNIKVYRPSR